MRLLLSLLLLSAPALAGTVALEGSTDSLELITSAAGTVHYHATWANVTATALTTLGTSDGSITTAATTSIVAAPAASNWRHVRSVAIFNASTTVANTVTVQVNRSGAARIICRSSLAPGEQFLVLESGECDEFDSAGRKRVVFDQPGYSGSVLTFSKVATAVDTIGYHYMYAKDTGFPGAMTLGAPGLNGANFTCNTAGGAAVPGSHVLPDPATGGWYLTRFGLAGATVNTYELVDLIWYNTGIVVTTTTNQAITTAAFPARDISGSANGEGYRIAMYFSAASTSAAAIANTTVTYTNSSGTATRTATLSGTVGFQAPASPVIGTWVPFLLQAGDTGVQSIQGITLGTSYVTGTINLVVYRPLAQEGVSTANFPSGSLMMRQAVNPGVRLWNGTCFALSVRGAPATTAPGVYGGVIEVMER